MGRDELARVSPPAMAPPGAQEVMLLLQRHLLPTGLPVLPQARLAARHLVGTHGPGGGCFDAFALGDGTVVLMAGHALGQGPGAAAAMAELRTALREALLRGGGPDEALAEADGRAGQVPGIQGAAVCLGLLNPASGSLCYACAGAPAPLACAPDGRVSVLARPDGGPLGAHGRPPLADAALPPGAVLVLCSGGQEPAAATAAALAGENLHEAKAADRACAVVAGRLAGGPPGGDVTVLAAHRRAAPAAALSLRLAGEPADLRGLRTRLADWLDELGVAPLDRVDTELAVYEAAANAIIHGRPERGAAGVSVDIGLDGTGEAVIEVADRGRWRIRPGPQQPGGRGLSVISKVTSQLSITPSPDGTTVVMRKPLSHSVTVGRAG